VRSLNVCNVPVNVSTSSDKQKKKKNKKINDKKVKNTMSLLTQFGDKHTYNGGYQGRKEIH